MSLIVVGSPKKNYRRKKQPRKNSGAKSSRAKASTAKSRTTTRTRKGGRATNPPDESQRREPRRGTVTPTRVNGSPPSQRRPDVVRLARARRELRDGEVRRGGGLDSAGIARDLERITRQEKKKGRGIIDAPLVEIGSEGDIQRLRGATYDTYFKAMGIMGTKELFANMRDGESPSLLEEDDDRLPIPAAFYSQQSGVLGKVKWQGIVPLDDLVEELNGALQFVGEEISGFDFREAYDYWELTYRVFERIGGVPVREYKLRRSGGRRK